MLRTRLIAPLLATLVAACGQKETPPAPSTAEAPKPVVAAAAPAAPPAAPEAAAAPAAPAGGKGEETFKKVCFLCHQTGVGGAPKLGDKADWGPRIAQGKALLYTHAIGGFTGKKGTMPPKGANPSLSDDDIKAAVDFMVSKAE